LYIDDRRKAFRSWTEFVLNNGEQHIGLTELGSGGQAPESRRTVTGLKA
jgi:hypothetical protein